MDNKTITQLENSKTEDAHTFFSKISNSFLEIDSEIMLIKEKLEDPKDNHNDLYKDELKALRDQREALRNLLEEYKNADYAQDKETIINTTWEKLKEASTNLLKKFNIKA